MPKKKSLTFCFYWLLTSFCLGQVDSLTFHISSESTLKSVVGEICSRQHYLIAYTPQLADLKVSESGTMQVASIDQLFTTLFPDQLQIVSLSSTQHLVRAKVESPIHDHFIFKGRVLNEEGDPLPDILVYTSSGLSTFSDSAGSFELPNSAEDPWQEITFNGIGFETQVKAFSEILDNPAVMLETMPLTFAPVMIQSKIPTIKIDNIGQSTVVRRRSLGQSWNSLNAQDLIKKMQFLPGVHADDDLSAQIKIRGSTGNESLIELDGIPLYRVDHFYGIYGSINSDYIEQAQLYKNALPIEYGGKTGGMLSLRSAPKITSPSATLEFDLLSSSLNFSTPLSPTWSLQLAGRTTYRNSAQSTLFDLAYPNQEYYLADAAPINSNILLPTKPQFDFYDFNSKIRYSLNSKWSFETNYYQSYDDLNNDFDLSFKSRINRVTVENSQEFRNQEYWKHQGASLNVAGKLSSQTTLKSSTYFTRYNRDAALSSLFYLNRPHEIKSIGVQNEQINDVRTLGSTTYLLSQNPNTTFKSGLDYKYHRSTYLFSEDSQHLLSGRDRAHEVSLFGEKVWQRPRYMVTLGARATYYSADLRWHLDPKAQLSYYIDEHNTIKTSAHISHQYVREINYESRLGQSSDYLVLSNGSQYPVGSALQFMMGYSYMNDNWILDLEVYGKDLDGTLEFGLQMPGFNEEFSPVKNRSYQIFSGSGEIFGLDLLISKEWKKYETQISYTLSKSSRQFREIRNNLPFPAQDDRRHQLKWINNFDLGPVTLSANYIFSSGKPYFAIK